MSPTLAACVSDFLLWTGGLLLAVLVVGFFVRQPARRIAQWWAAVVGIAALAVLAISPRWSTVHLRSELVQPMVNELESPRGATGVPPVEAADQRHPQDVHWRHASGTRPAAKPIDWPKLLLTIYLGGSAVTGGWLVLGYMAARGLVRGAKSASVRVAGLAGHLNSERMPQLLESDRLASAVALGLWRPTVVLPREFCERVSDEELRSVLAHELAHVRHGDLWLLAALVTLAPLLWCQPLFWLLRRRVRLDQETLADAAAADHTTRPDYAANLLAWARTATTVRPAPLTAPLTATVGLWESPAQLKARIATLLDDRLVLLRHTTRRWRLLSMIAIVTLAGGLSLVTWAPAQQISSEVAKPRVAKSESTAENSVDRLPSDSPSSMNLDELWITAKTPNAIMVYVADKQSQPLTNVGLTFRVSGSSQMPGSTELSKGETDANGIYLWKNSINLKQDIWKQNLNDEGQLPDAIAMGTPFITVVASKPGYASQIGGDMAARVYKDGALIKIQLESPTAPLTGRVVDQSGKPVLGAVVNGNGRSFGSVSLIQFATTNDQGEFSITDMKAVDHGEKWEILRKQQEEERRSQKDVFVMVGGDDFRTFFSVTHPDFAEAAVPYTKIPSNHEVVLRPGGKISGRLVDADTNQPIAGVRLQLNTDDSIKMPPIVKTGDPAQCQFQATDAEGRFEFRSLRPGSFRLWVNKPGLFMAGDPTRRPVVSVSEGEYVTMSDVMVTKGKPAVLQLVDAKTREPLKFKEPSSKMPVTAHKYMKPPKGSKATLYSELIGLFEIEFDVSGKGQCQLPLGTYSIGFGNVMGWQEAPWDDPKVPRVITITDDENQIIEIPMEQREPQVDGAVFRAN